MVESIEPFGFTLLLAGVAVTVALLSNRIGARSRIPAGDLPRRGRPRCPALSRPCGHLPIEAVERHRHGRAGLILFDGGMHIGLARFRPAAGPVVWLGVAGHVRHRRSRVAVLRPRAVRASAGCPRCSSAPRSPRPTPPWSSRCWAGARSPAGRGTLLEGESGANDPVGIALMAALLDRRRRRVRGRRHGRARVRAADGVGRRRRARRRRGAAVAACARLPLPSEGALPAADARLRAASSTASPPSRTGRASWPCFSPASWSVTRGRRTSGRSSASTRALASLGEIVAFVVLG